jgi:hypothetical protein
MDFAKREFGEINDLFKRQIEQVFKRPVEKTPKPGEGGITSIKNAPKKKDETAQASGSIMDQIEASKNKIEGASNRITEIQKEIDQMYKPKPETSPLMERLEKGIETLKTMKQPGMDLATGLTRTAARKILDRSGIQVPDKVDPIDFFVQEFGADALMDVKNVAEEMIEIESMGKATKSIDEILEQTGMFDIKRNPDAPKGISDEELEQIKKEVDQEKQLKDFDPTDREPNAMGGINRTSFALGGMKAIMAIINQIKKLDPMDAMKEVNEVVAKRGKYKNLDDDEVKKIFDETNDHIFERDVPADEFAVRFDDEAEKLSELAPKAAERFKLKKMYPGIDEEFLTKIIDDPDPQRKAEVLATLDQSMELMKQGKGGDEVVDILKQGMNRKKNSKGGLQYLMGM